MPPKVRYTKEAIVEAAMALTRRGGIEAVNARAIAGELGCSTQPLFRVFQSMEEIRQEVTAAAGEIYGLYIARAMAEADRPYKGSGMGYLQFAAQEPQLFKLLFMCDREEPAPMHAENDPSLQGIMELLMKTNGMTYQQAETFHLHSWVFVHGLASMIATHFVTFTPEQLSRLLTDDYRANLLLFDQEMKQKSEKIEKN